MYSSRHLAEELSQELPCWRFYATHRASPFGAVHYVVCFMPGNRNIALWVTPLEAGNFHIKLVLNYEVTHIRFSERPLLVQSFKALVIKYVRLTHDHTERCLVLKSIRA